MKTLLCLLLSTLSLTAADTLHLYTWADYVSPDVVEKFEEKNHCKVVIDTFDSNETMFAKLKAGATGYDVVVPTSYMIQLMASEGMLMDLDVAKMPNTKHIDKEVLAKLHDQTMKSSVPYTVAYTVLAFRKDKVKDTVNSWAMLDRVDLAGRMTLLDDMRESIGAALKFLGYSLNSRDEKELAAAQEVLLHWKKNAAKFDNEGYKAGLDSGEFQLVQGYSGDLFQVAQENDKVEIVVPKEGVPFGCDEMVILKTAKQPELAQAWIDFLLDPEIAAENMEWMGYLCPNTEALKKVSPEFLQNPAVTVPEDIRAKCEAFEDLGADLAKYTKVWDVVKQ